MSVTNAVGQKQHLMEILGVRTSFQAQTVPALSLEEPGTVCQGRAWGEEGHRIIRE